MPVEPSQTWKAVAAAQEAQRDQRQFASQDGNGWVDRLQLDVPAKLQGAPFPLAAPRTEASPEVLDRQAALAREKANLVAYLGFRVADEDWHGVIDAAGDLRVIEAEMRGLER